MAVKFNEYWNIVPNKSTEYVEFMQKHRIPTLNKLGINVAALWCVLVGSSPQVISEGIAEDTERLESALKNTDYDQTITRLLKYITDYKSKVLIPTGRFQHLPRVTKVDTIKFSQYWDIIPGNEETYDQFIKNEYYPSMEELGILVGGEWKILIGESPHLIFEGRCEHIEKLLTSLNSTKYRTLKFELLKLVSNYSSRILVLHAFKTMGTKCVDYEFFII